MKIKDVTKNIFKNPRRYKKIYEIKGENNSFSAFVGLRKNETNWNVIFKTDDINLEESTNTPILKDAMKIAGEKICTYIDIYLKENEEER